MGDVTVVEFVSLDGVVQSPLSATEDPSGGFAAGGWVPSRSDELVDGLMSEVTTSAGALLMGRRTYDAMAAAWAGADDAEPAVAAMRRMTKHVVTSRPVPAGWGESRRVVGDLADAVPALSGDTDGDVLVFGSARLVHALRSLDLVDRYRLLLFPVVLGGGKRLFEAEVSPPHDLRLVSAAPTPAGVVLLDYRR